MRLHKVYKHRESLLQRKRNIPVGHPAVTYPPEESLTQHRYYPIRFVVSIMHLAVPIQLFIVALAATQSSASPPAAPISNGVETRTAHGAVEKRSFWNVHRMLYRLCHRQPFVDVYVPQNGRFGCQC